jgi:hypothetical protein
MRLTSPFSMLREKKSKDVVVAVVVKRDQEILHPVYKIILLIRHLLFLCFITTDQQHQ